MGRYGSSNSGLRVWMVLGIFALVILLFVGKACVIPTMYYEEIDEVKVKRLENVNNGDSSKYLVYTEQGEVFQNEDSIVYGKFNSSDIYGRMDKGKCYRIEVAGVRWHFPTMYRNIIKLKEKQCSKK